MSRNFRIDFEKAEDDKTPQEELVYTAYRSATPIQTISDLESATSITQVTGANLEINPLTVQIPDEDQYLNITVKDKANNIALYDQVFVEQAPPVIAPPTEEPEITSVTTRQTEIDVTFNPVANATFYEYRIGGGSFELISNNTFFTVTGFDANQSSNVQVRAGNSGGKTDWSIPFEFTTQQEDPPSTAPSITAFEWDLNSVTITHSLVTGAKGYRYRLNENIISGDIGVTGQFTISGLFENTTNEVEVQAFNDGGNSDWSEAITFTTDAQVTAQPVITQVVNTSDPVSVFFNEVDFATEYEYRTDLGTPIPIISNPFDIVLDENNTYGLQIRGRNEYGEGPWSVVETFTTDYTAPVIADTAISVDNLTIEGFTLNFAKATDNITAQEDLTYKYYEGDEQLLNSLDTIESQSLRQTGVDVPQFIVNASEGEFIQGNVLVEDEAGNKSIYEAFSVLIPEQTIEEVTIEGGDFELVEGGQETYDFFVDVIATEGAEDSVKVSSSDTSIVAITDLGDNNFRATLQTPLAETTQVTITAVSDFDSSYKDTVTGICTAHDFDDETESEEFEFTTEA